MLTEAIGSVRAMLGYRQMLLLLLLVNGLRSVKRNAASVMRVTDTAVWQSPLQMSHSCWSDTCSSNSVPTNKRQAYNKNETFSYECGFLVIS